MNGKSKSLRENVGGNSSLISFIGCLLLLTCLNVLPVMAYREGPAADPEEMIGTLKDRLELTDAQVEQIRPVIQEQDEKRRELFEKYRSQGRQGRSGMRSEIETLQAETEAQLASILSEEQMEAYRTLQKERREQMRKNRGARRSCRF